MINTDLLNRPLVSLTELEQIQEQVYACRNLNRTGNIPCINANNAHWRGQGIELFDTRPYHTGDDIRHIDWRTSARSGHTVSKIFTADLGRKLILIIDRRAGMFFGTCKEIKAATAARVAAMLAFSALHARESVSALILDKTIQSFPLISNTNQLFPLLSRLTEPSHDIQPGQISSNFSQIFEEILNLYEPGTSLCLISDFSDLTRKDLSQWALIGKHFDTTAIRVIDIAEQQLKNTGLLRVRSPFSDNTLLIDSSKRKIREDYAKTARLKTHELKVLFSNNNINFFTLLSDDDLFARLQFLL